MVEYFTEALVLDKQDLGEMDSLVHFYTEEMGKVSGKLKSAKRMKSKSNAHLEPVHFVKVRLIAGRNGNIQVIDAMPFKKSLKKEIKKSSENLAKYLKIAHFIKEMTFDFHADPDLWRTIKHIFASDVAEVPAYGLLLKNFGFDPKYAGCNLCGDRKIGFFSQKDHLFLCHGCIPVDYLEARNSQMIRIV